MNTLGTKHPKILVALPVYNEERLLKRAIHSILDQTYTNFEIKVIDDKSTDGSLNEARKFLYDSRVSIIENEKNAGCFYSKNLGISFMSSGKYDIYTTHDADDFSQPDRFEKVVDVFNSDSSILGVEDLELRFGNTPPEWYNTPFTPMSNLAHAFFKDKAFEALGFFDNTAYSGDEDYWSRLRSFCIKNNYKMHTIKKVLYYAEIAEKNMILSYGDDVREVYRNNFKKEINAMYENNNFYRPFFDIDKAVK